MKLRTYVVFLIAAAVTFPVLAAPGDILSIEILGSPYNGWAAKVRIAGVAAGGTYDYSTVFGDQSTLSDLDSCTFRVSTTAPGYDVTGTAVTVTRSLCGTSTLRQPYPNQASLDETVVGSDLDIVVALSGYVHVNETSISVTVDADWYESGGVGSNTVTTTAANFSTMTTPPVIARWVDAPFRVVGSARPDIGRTQDIELEMVGYHFAFRDAKQMAAVVFECVGQSSSNVHTVTVTEMSASVRADGLPVMRATVPTTAFADEDVICDFEAYPWVGDATDVRDSASGSIGTASNATALLDLGPLKFRADAGGTYGTTVAYVSTTGNNGTCVAADVDSDSTAAVAPCADVSGALTAVRTYNNTNYSRNNADGGAVYLEAGTHTLGSTPSVNASDDYWVTITSAPGVSQAAAILQSSSVRDFNAKRLRFYDITIETLSNSNLTIDGGSGDVLLLEKVDVAGQNLSDGLPVVWDFDASYFIDCTVDSVGIGLSKFSSRGKGALHRNNTFTTAGLSVDASRVTFGNRVTTDSTRTDIFWQGCETASNCISAYNRFSGRGSMHFVNEYPSSGQTDMAIVGNVGERTTPAQPAAFVSVGGDSETTPTYNVLIFGNTWAGGRSNTGYSDTATDVTRDYWCQYANSHYWNPIKGDVFATVGNVGNWPILNGVCFEQENSSLVADQFIPDYYGPGSLRASDPAYVDDAAAVTGTGVGGGDYTPNAGSPLIDRLRSGGAWASSDLFGTRILDNGKGSSGAVQPPIRASHPGIRKWMLFLQRRQAKRDW